MYHLTIYTHFAAAHNLINYQGDCENLHGHNWKVEVTVTAEDLDDAGLAIDFKILKAYTKEILARLDHKYLNDLDAFKNHSPSSENIARYLFYELSAPLAAKNVKIDSVKVWESENACASYSQG
ncbi:MAG: 6-carboxytetrahydropterin synthase QueD [Desulfuromonas sp.]|nr:MAG: 6-carboxytetrahydropterin synthase QueD [Desulfuromonas sp.]